MANTIANSSAKNNFFTVGGVAITSTTQPKVDVATFAGILDTSLGTHPNDRGIISTFGGSVYTGFDKVSIIRSLSNSLRGTSNTSIRSPGSEIARESIMQLDAVRTVKTASAIRNNQWVGFSGVWSSSPATSSDLSALGNDDEADSNRAAPGAFAWAYAGSGVQESYGPRTQ